MVAEGEADKKTEETTEVVAKAAEPAKEEAKSKALVKPQESEEDAAEETRPKISPGSAGINAADSTLNVLQCGNGKLLMSVMEGGTQYLLAGARTAVGVKSGRYLVEAKIIESHKAVEQQGSQGRVPMPRNLVRLGLSHAGTSLFLADGSTDNISFDSEGFLVNEKSRKKVAQKSERDTVLGLLINLEEGSKNANTISLFRNGVRACEPQPIPEALRGKPLFPTVTYKNVTLQLNCGPAPLAPLPFHCHMLASAAVADAEVVIVPEPKGGKYEVVMPVGLPEQGYFDWVDTFIAQNPDFTELSDRKILDWATKSGLWRPKAAGSSLDKPDMKFGVPQMDDFSIRRVINHIAPTAKRNFIVPELKSNLILAERKEALLRFPAEEFKRTAAVFVGEPTAEFKEQVQGLILEDKKGAAVAELKKKQEDEARKRLVEQRRKMAEKAKKAREMALKRKKEGLPEEPAEEEEEELAEEKEVSMEVEVELTDEEKALWYRKSGSPDVSDTVISKLYSHFTLPSADEGFDEISYKWNNEADAAKFLKDWIFAKKLTQRVDDIQPGSWFKEELPKFTKILQEWRKKQSEWKDPVKKKALLAARAAARKKEAEEKGEEATQEEMEIDADDIEPSTVEDVNDIGSGEPLFANFGYEDWAMLAVRYEFHLLLLSFRKDLDDADRTSFTAKDLPFYYNKYYKKTFNIKGYARETIEGLVDIMKDTVKINKESSFFETLLPEDTMLEKFVKLAEEHRRERQRRMDAGDETAELKFPRIATAPATRPGMTGPVQPGPVRAQPGMVPRAAGSGIPAAGAAAGAQKRVLSPAAPVSSAYVAKQPRTSPYGAGYNRK